MKMRQATCNMLSLAHEQYAGGNHHNAYRTMSWFALGCRTLYCRRGKMYFWWANVMGRRV